MAMNTVQISARNLPYDTNITAGGSYTLPRYAFIPHPCLQQLSSGMVQEPTQAINTADFAAPPQLQRAYPTPLLAGVYGVRMVTIKGSPA